MTSAKPRGLCRTMLVSWDSRQVCSATPIMRLKADPNQEKSARDSV